MARFLFLLLLPGTAVALFLPGSDAFADAASDLRSFVGDRDAKLVAVDRGDSSRIYLLDTTKGGSEPSKIADDIECDSPLISPDGTRVVYNQLGKVYIQPIDGGDRKLVTEGSEGHWWIDPADDKEWIYFTDNTKEKKLRWPDNQGIKTHRIRLEDNVKEWVVDWKAGGGPSRDGTHVGSGYASVIIFDLVNKTEHLLYTGGQGCNPSMSPDDSYVIMHLDLPHDTFSIRDKTDKLLWTIEKPDQMAEWQHPEWSNDGDFAAATAKESNGTYSVFVIKLSTQETLKVIESGTSGRDWAHPHLWVKDARADVPSLPPPPSSPSGDGGATTDAGGDAGADDCCGPCSLIGDEPVVMWPLPLALLVLVLSRRRR